MFFRLQTGEWPNFERISIGDDRLWYHEPSHDHDSSYITSFHEADLPEVFTRLHEIIPQYEEARDGVFQLVDEIRVPRFYRYNRTRQVLEELPYSRIAYVPPVAFIDSVED